MSAAREAFSKNNPELFTVRLLELKSFKIEISPPVKIPFPVISTVWLKEISPSSKSRSAFPALRLKAPVTTREFPPVTTKLPFSMESPSKNKISPEELIFTVSEESESPVPVTDFEKVIFRQAAALRSAKFTGPENSISEDGLSM